MSENSKDVHREGWLIVNEVPTHVQTWGGWIEDDLPGDAVIVCITGNPGVTGFYSSFLSCLHQNLGLPVWVINHAGLEFPPKRSLKAPSLNENPHLYNLEGQIIHKYKFLKDYVPNDKKIYLIGHSVGGKMTAGVLKHEDIIDRTLGAYFMFPTLQHIAKSKFGRGYTRISKFFVPILLCAVWVLSVLPLRFREYAVGWYFSMRKFPNKDPTCTKAALQLLNPKSLKAAFFLATDEMFTIKDLDIDVMEKLGDRVNCYYGSDDGWAPTWQCDDIKQRCPKAHTTILPPNYKHAFVLSNPTEIANIISTDIKEKSNRKI